jgi:hypothetical protein
VKIPTICRCRFLLYKAVVMQRVSAARHRAGKVGKLTPDPLEMPYGYKFLLLWYRDWSAAPPVPSLPDDPLLALQQSRTSPGRADSQPNPLDVSHRIGHGTPGSI